MSVDRIRPAAVIVAGYLLACAPGEGQSASGESTGDEADDGMTNECADRPCKVEEIAMTSGTTCALTQAGTVRCWGHGSFGTNGNASLERIGDDELPASAGDVELSGSAIGITAGFQHVCALLEGGLVQCWGINWHGELGYPGCEGDSCDDPACCIGDDETPASAGTVELAGPAVQVLASGSSTCALLEDGRVQCWGYPVSRLGSGLGDAECDYPDCDGAAKCCIGDDETPVDSFVDLGGPVSELTAHGYWASITCALMEAGGLRCWGGNSSGQLGHGNTENGGADEVPAETGDVPINASVAKVASALRHTCAITQDGDVRCWGSNGGGVLGTGVPGTIGDDEPASEAPAIPFGRPATDIASAPSHNCAVFDDGSVSCWGESNYGRLGDFSTSRCLEEDLYGPDFSCSHHPSCCIGDDEVPMDFVELGGEAKSVAVSTSNSCAVLTNGRVRCWGDSSFGSNGYPLSDECDIGSDSVCKSGRTCCIGDDETPADAGDVVIFFGQ